MTKASKSKICQVCGKTFVLEKLFPVALVRKSIADLIKKNVPELDPQGYICMEDLHHFRAEQLEMILKEEKGQLSVLDKEVIESFRENELLTEDLNKEYSKKLSLGSYVADRVAHFGGSWPFICLFIVLLLCWIGVNSAIFLLKPFDPYPFILLNLVLSCLAALQAPIIMMSQNRQAEKDHIKADYEYTINVNAELQVRQLNSKIDVLMKNQWERLLEIHQIQIDLLEHIAAMSDHKKGK